MLHEVSYLPTGETDQPYRYLLDALQEGIWVIDRDAITTFVNPRMAEMLGYSVDEMIGRPVFDFMDAAGVEMARANIERRAQGIREEHDFELIHRDGRRVYTIMSVSPMNDPAGGYAGAIAGVIDIGERRRAEAALLQAKHAAERARQDERQRREEAEKRREIADGLRTILAALNRHQALPQVLGAIMQQAERLLGTSAAAIYSYDLASEDLVLEAARNFPADHPCWPDSRVAARRAVSLGHQSLVDLSGDVTAAPRTCEEPTSPDVRNEVGTPFLLALPVLIGESVRGAAVFIFSGQPASWDETVQLAEAICNQIGLAIETHYLRIRQEQVVVAAERSRLARDLHDSVTQALFSASLVAEVLPQIWERDPAEAAAGLEELRILARSALAEMRALLLELRPGDLLETRLDDLLRQLVGAMAPRGQMSALLDLQPAPLLPPEVQVAFYRVAQEALQNALKHSGGTLLEIKLETCPPFPSQLQGRWRGEVQLAIRDDGRGITAEYLRPDQFGLRSMRERAEKINARLTIGNALAGGALVTLAWQNN
jgi:PAS domain S-box-containing protein